MNPDHLLDLADHIARMEAGKPRQASLKRAISTAYYALFHALAQECVDRAVGLQFSAARHWQIVTPIYRAIEHGSAKRLFERLARAPQTSDQLRLLSDGFVELQTARIAADYDPARRYRREDALDLIGQAGQAIASLLSLSLEERLLLVVQLVTKPR